MTDKKELIEKKENNLLPSSNPDYGLKGDLKLLARGIKEGWEIPKETMDDALDAVSKILKNPNADPRALVNASRVVIAMRQQDLDAYQILDKIDRLEAGKSTENVAQSVKIEFE